MCGITGFFSPSAYLSRGELQETIAPMVKAITHRGPDSDGSYVDSNCGLALGHTRLSIIDRSSAGEQPMTSFDKRFIIVFNGEIYNAPDLRNRLPNPDFPGHSDTRILLELIASQGLAATLPTLNGMFAMAVWDCENRQLSLARDPLGKKPLYYTKDSSLILFGSELHSLRAHPQFDATLNASSAARFLQKSYVPGPDTIYQKVKQLPAGTFLTFTKSHLEPAPQAYWSMAELHRKPLSAPEDPLSATLEVAQTAVRRRLLSDAPLGAFLSGGIDSGLVVGLMTREMNPSSIQTFALGFEEKRYNEAPHARAVADHLGTDHHEFILTPKLALETIPELSGIYDQPFGDTSQLPTVLLSRFTKKHVTVALSGDGGDELFGGYNRYFKTLALFAKQSKSPLLSQLARSLPLPPQELLPSLARSMARLRVQTPTELLEVQSTRILNPCKLIPEASPLSLPPTLSPSSRSPLEDLLLHDILTWLPDDILVKVDRASMSCALEVRSPLLDRELLELAWNIPISQRTSSSNPKHLLKTLLSEFVPPSIFERPKSGFAVPLAPWLSGPLRDWAESQFSTSALSNNPILDPRATRSLWQGFLKSPKKLSRPLWNVLMLQAWFNEQSKSASRC